MSRREVRADADHGAVFIEKDVIGDAWMGFRRHAVDGAIASRYDGDEAQGVLGQRPAPKAPHEIDCGLATHRGPSEPNGSMEGIRELTSVPSRCMLTAEIAVCRAALKTCRGVLTSRRSRCGTNAGASYFFAAASE